VPLSDAGAGTRPNMPGQLVITELMVDTDVVADDIGEWLEIYNPSADTLYDLFGCLLRDEQNTHVISERLLVPPGRYVTMARFPRCMPSGFVPDYSYLTGGTNDVKFGNQGDTATLHCGTTDIDVVNYHGFALVSGHAFSLDPTKISDTANDAASAWCSAVNPYNSLAIAATTDYGTPGMANPSCN